MTNQEAIKILDNKAIEATGILGSLPDSAKETSFLQNDIKAYNIAIAAIEKQIPKKPVKKSFIIPYEGINVCPSCKEPLGGKKYYCCECGQKLDWSEEGNTRLDLMRECGKELGE